ncbi:MAG: hypothetical protein M0R06_02510 [Sphaerochaeta sp.]|jgi:hypothetical protein|nr:hypothetical protein [Sphaerochaeta sp.]
MGRIKPEIGKIIMDEVSRILEEVSVRVQLGERNGTVRDKNGNPVGGFDQSGDLFTLSINTENAAFQVEK